MFNSAFSNANNISKCKNKILTDIVFVRELAYITQHT